MIFIDQLQKRVESFRNSEFYCPQWYNESTSNSKIPALFDEELRKMCGRRIPLPLISSGNVSSPHAWPWQAFVLIFKPKNVDYCGGTLISDQWLLTVAHCFNSKVQKVHVFLGRPNIFGSNPKTPAMKILINKKDIYIHPDFSPGSPEDIALLKFPQPLTFAPHIRPACVAKTPEDLPQKCLVLAWGSKLDDIKPIGSLELQQLNISVRECKQNPEFYCGWTTERKRSGACADDSGGPLLCESENAFYVRGIFSSAAKSCDQRPGFSPGYYTNVSHYLSWIRNTVHG